MLRAWLSGLVVLVAAVVVAQGALRLDQPRSTFTTFLALMTEGRVAEAAKAIEPGAGSRSAAERLAAVLRKSLIDPDQIVTESGGDTALVSRYRDRDGVELGAITIQRASDGLWRFSKSSVDALPAIERVLGLKAASEPSDEPSISADAGVPSSGEAAAAIAPYASPRATLSTFLLAMNEGRIGDATKAIDATANPLVPGTQRERQANLLFAIFNRTQFIHLESLPVDPNGPPFTLFSYRNPATGSVIGEIVLSRQSDGAWRFTAGTLSELEAIWKFVQDRPVLVGLKDINPIAFEPDIWLRDRMPVSWHAPLAGLQRWQWLVMLSLVLGSAIVALVIRSIGRAIFARRFQGEESEGSRKSLVALGRSLGWIIFLTLGRYGVPFVGLPDWLEGFLTLLCSAGLAFAWCWFLFTLLDRLLHFFSDRAARISDRGQRLVVPVIGRFGRVLIVLGVSIVVLSRMGVNVVGIVAGLGIGGLVLALAAKDSVENLFGSFTILVEMPFGIGDWVKIGDVEGVVEQINLRSTRVRTFRDSVIILPNKNLITAAVENMGARRYRQFQTTVGLSYDTPPALVSQFCEQVITRMRGMPAILPDKARCALHDFSASTLSVLLSCYISTPDYDEELVVRSQVMRAVLEVADSLQIDLAVPPAPSTRPRTPDQPLPTQP